MSFPVIANISDVLPAIEGDSSFIVADRGDHIIVNYVVAGAETFPPIMTRNDAIRRECRGITFDKASGRIIRRPYAKFFNLSEREETQPHNIDFSKSHHVLCKLDGSMIAPFRNSEGRIIFGTKMGNTDFVADVEVFISDKPDYMKLTEWCLFMGFTPIFEWCSRKNRIVIDYSQDQLVLTAIRHMHRGDYHTFEEMHDLIEMAGYDIPVVQTYDSVTDVDKFIEHTRGLKDIEGYVVRFEDGSMVKVKADSYVQIHRAKDAITNERLVVQMILDGNIDDIKGFLPKEDLQRLETFERAFLRNLDEYTQELRELADASFEECEGDKKRFALEKSMFFSSTFKSMMFLLFGASHKARDVFINTLRKHLNQNIRYDEFKAEFWPDLIYHDQQEQDIDR